MKTKFINMILVLLLVAGFFGFAQPVKAEVTPWPVDGFWNEPAEPSIYDWIYFGLYGETPEDWVCHWNFGDGTTYDQCFVEGIKRYANDGDYSVSLEVTNSLGEVAFTNRVLSVRTYDVSITKFTVPQSARAGQTRQITVSISNSRYPEKVQVELYKDNFVWVGTSVQNMTVRPANRTTSFTFSYTFTAEDARVGKVTFHAMAFILENGGDDWPVDNDVVALPTRITR